MSTLSLFPVKIFKATYNCDLANLKEIVLEKINSVEKLHNQSSMRCDGFCSYNVLRDLNKIKEFSLLVDFINDQSQLYWKELQYATHMKPMVYEMWANVYKKNSFIDNHNHSPIHMTASFYLNQPLNGGNLSFENPNITLLKHQPYEIDNIRYNSIFEQEIEVNTGDLVIFPGWLNHRTKPNLSDEDRIIIGANVCNGI